MFKNVISFGLLILMITNWFSNTCAMFKHVDGLSGEGGLVETQLFSSMVPINYRLDIDIPSAPSDAEFRRAYFEQCVNENIAFPLEMNYTAYGVARTMIELFRKSGYSEKYWVSSAIVKKSIENTYDVSRVIEYEIFEQAVDCYSKRVNSSCNACSFFVDCVLDMLDLFVNDRQVGDDFYALYLDIIIYSVCTLFLDHSKSEQSIKDIVHGRMKEGAILHIELYKAFRNVRNNKLVTVKDIIKKGLWIDSDKKYYKVHTLDFHSVSPEQVCPILQQTLNMASKHNIVDTVNYIGGKGKHSINGVSLSMLCCIRWLIEQGFEAGVLASNTGIVSVRLHREGSFQILSTSGMLYAICNI